MASHRAPHRESWDVPAPLLWPRPCSRQQLGGWEPGRTARAYQVVVFVVVVVRAMVAVLAVVVIVVVITVAVAVLVIAVISGSCVTYR